jgi:hypothetical protein
MPKKGEKLDEAQLIKLGEARKKALEVRQEKATVKKQEKELATLERKEKSSSLKKQIDAKKSKKQEDHSVGYAQNEIIHQEQTIGQATFSSDEEQEAEPIKQPKVKSKTAPPRKVKRQVVYEEESSSSEEEAEVRTVRKNKPQQSSQRDISLEERNAIINQHYAEQQHAQDEKERQRYLGQAQQAIQTMPIRGGVRTNLFGGGY